MAVKCYSHKIRDDLPELQQALANHKCIYKLAGKHAGSKLAIREA
jgi:hypothetical protein